MLYLVKTSQGRCRVTNDHTESHDPLGLRQREQDSEDSQAKLVRVSSPLTEDMGSSLSLSLVISCLKEASLGSPLSPSQGGTVNPSIFLLLHLE